jgi:hypothetical protein
MDDGSPTDESERDTTAQRLHGLVDQPGPTGLTPASVSADSRSVAWSAIRLIAIAIPAGLLLSVDLYLAARSVGHVLAGAQAVDWVQYVEAAERLNGSDLYAVTDSYAYRYSPLLAAVFGLLAPLGMIGWQLLHLVAAAALPSWPLRIATLLSWPFWYDVETGNVMVFILLAAAWALRGSRLATGSYLILSILVPRPLMLPVAAWVLWKRPEWRLPFAAAFLAHTLAVLAIGWGPEWVGTIVAAGRDASLPSNVGPSRLIGTLPWLAIGLPLAALLTWRGRVGLASIAASPYWLPYYLIMPLLELVRPAASDRHGR